MRNIRSLAVCALVAIAALTQFGPAQAQLPSETPEERVSKALLAQVLQQQKTLTDNQAKIDEKLATIAENIRVARLFQARAK